MLVLARNWGSMTSDWLHENITHGTSKKHEKGPHGPVIRKRLGDPGLIESVVYVWVVVGLSPLGHALKLGCA